MHGHEVTCQNISSTRLSIWLVGIMLRMIIAMLLLVVISGCVLPASRSPGNTSHDGLLTEPEHDSKPSTVSQWISQPRPGFP